MSSAFPSLTQLPPAKPTRPHGPSVSAPVRRRGLLLRVLDALIEARRDEAERQVARLLARSGGRFTDSLEREAGRAPDR